MDVFSRQDPGYFCPFGGEFYACTSGTLFFGCCAVPEPCVSGCQEDDVFPTSFNNTYYTQIPVEQCLPGSQWYICPSTDPPFLGCCRSEACQEFCQPGFLEAAYRSIPSSSTSTGTASLSTLPGTASGSAFTLSASSTWTTSSLLSARSSTSNTGPTGSLSSTPFSAVSSSSAYSVGTSASNYSSTAQSTPPKPVSAIAGGTIGGVGVVLFGLLFGLYLFYWRRHIKDRQKERIYSGIGPFGYDYSEGYSAATGPIHHNEEVPVQHPPSSHPPFHAFAAKIYGQIPFLKKKEQPTKYTTYRFEDQIENVNQVEKVDPPYELPSSDQNPPQIDRLEFPDNHSASFHTALAVPVFPYSPSSYLEASSRRRGSLTISELSADDQNSRSPRGKGDRLSAPTTPHRVTKSMDDSDRRLSSFSEESATKREKEREGGGGEIGSEHEKGNGIDDGGEIITR